MQLSHNNATGEGASLMSDRSSVVGVMAIRDCWNQTGKPHTLDEEPLHAASCTKHWQRSHKYNLMKLQTFLRPKIHIPLRQIGI